MALNKNLPIFILGKIMKFFYFLLACITGYLWGVMLVLGSIFCIMYFNSWPYKVVSMLVFIFSMLYLHDIFSALREKVRSKPKS